MTCARVIRRFIALGLLSVWSSPVLHAAGAHKPFQIYDFSKGVDTYHNPTALPDGFAQDSLNVLFDDKSPVSKRTGYTVAWSTTPTYSFTNLWTYTDATNTSWQIARSSTQITASNLAGSIVKIATVAASNIVGETNGFGNAYFVDQTQGVYYWNGTSTTYIAGSPQGSIITQFHNRLAVTGAAVPNGNQLYLSGYYAGNNWTTGLNPTDPAQYSIGLQDNFDNTTAEYVYIDTLYIFKHYSIFALYGFDQTSFQISQLTQECGCIDGNTIQTYNGGLKFVSLRGVEDFNGYTCKRISDPIKNKIDPSILAAGFSQQSWVQQNTNDWTSGTFSPGGSISTGIASPGLTLQSASTSYVDSPTFGAGTFSSTLWSGSGVTLQINRGGPTNPDFESGNSWWTFFSGPPSQTTAPSWPSSTSGQNCTLTPHNGSVFYDFSGNTLFSGVKLPFQSSATLLSCQNNAVLSQTVFTLSPNNCSWTKRTLSGSGLGDRCVYINITDNGNTESILQSPKFIADGNDITFYTASDNTTAPGFFVGLDDFDPNNGLNSLAPPPNYGVGTYTSPAFDAGAPNTTVLPNAGWTAPPIPPLSFQIPPPPKLVFQKSSDGSHWTDMTTSTGSNVTGLRYTRFISSWTQTDITNPTDINEVLSSVTIQISASSGSLQTQIHNIGTIGSWGNFSVGDVLNGGNIVFSICGSTNSNMSQPVTCASQTPNSQINISTKSYVQWYATFTVTSATQTPTLQNGTVQWFTGTTQIPMASTVWDNRYWLSLTTNTADTTNDAVLVLNSKGAWSPWNIHAGGFTQYKNSLYHADSLASGNIYLDNQGEADNGSAINAYVRTKTESLGDLASDDYLYDVYPAATNTGNCTMTVQYTLDKSTNTFNLGSPLLSEYGTMSSVRLPFPIDTSHMDFGQSVDFTIGTNDALCDWQFLGLEGLYKSRPVQ